jgi:4-amino-4-deoxy-L-arabinose transferase-like glycosyltransferase
MGALTTRLGLVAVLAVHGFALWLYFVPNLGSPDANSYHVSARMIELENRFSLEPEDDLAFMGGMWLMSADGVFHPKYPPLYPALAGALMKVFDDPVGLLVTPICAWLAVLGAFVLCRAWLPGWAALFGAFALATSPLLNSFALDQIAHTPSVAALTWGFALLLLGSRSSGWKRTLLFFGSGLLIGYAGGVRYTNVLLALPALLWFIYRIERTKPAEALPWLAGAAVPWAAVALYHLNAFGSPLRTAYSLTDEQSAFSLAHLVDHAPLYVPAFFTHLVGPVALLALVGAVDLWRTDWRKGVVFASWLLPLTLTYMCYYFAPPGHVVSYIRFLMPLIVPCLVLALLFAAKALSHVGPRARVALIALLFVAQGGWGIARSLRHMEVRYGNNEMNVRKLDLVRDHAPDGSVVFGERWLLDGLDYEQVYSLYEDDLLSRELLRSMVTRFMRKASLQSQRFAVVKAQLVDVDERTYRRRVRALIDGALADGRDVFVVSDAERLALARAEHGDAYTFERVAETGELEPAHRILERPRKPMAGWEAVALVRVRRKP